MTERFTKEEIQILRANPNVLSVTDCYLRFTPDFKARAYEAYMNGTMMKEFFIDNDLDPQMIGDTRIYSFTNNLKNKAQRDRTFEDSRQFNRRRPISDEDPYDRINDLEHKVAYLTQEVEFLKKNVKADMEARALWESRHLPTSSTRSSKKH